MSEHHPVQLKVDTYEGKITIENFVQDITLSISVDYRSEIIIEEVEVDVEIYTAVETILRKPGLSVSEFELDLRSSDGKAFYSNRVQLTSLSCGTNGYRIKFRCLGADITVPLDTEQDKPIIRYWLRSYRQFPQKVVESKLGSIVVEGMADQIDINDIGGSITIQSNTSDPDADWRAEAKSLLDHIHQCLQLARGGKIQIPRVDYVHDSLWTAAFYAGRGFRREMPIKSHLDMGGYIESMVQNYEEHGRIKDELWNILGWIQVDTTFSSIRFITAMTAIEAVISKQPNKSKGAIVRKNVFKKILKSINNVIDSTKELNDDQKRIFKSKFDNTNNKSLGNRILDNINELGINGKDFNKENISTMNRIRNQILHEGKEPSVEEIWPYIILARELIVRVLLKELKYKGRYTCYIGGAHERAL